MNKILLTILIFLVLTVSCKFKELRNDIKNSEVESVTNQFRKDSLVSILKLNKEFFKDSLLKDNSGIVEHYFSLYQSDTCGIQTYNNSELKEEFEGIRILKGIRTGKHNDTVFVMPNFSYCDDGESYCFYDKELPRLPTDSYCCQPDNLFVCPDIDEDGVNEIGIYYSTCTSRYKSLRIYSLKNKQWKEIGNSDFDILTKDPTKVSFSSLVKKVRKNSFSICNFTDGKTKWETIVMK